MSPSDFNFKLTVPADPEGASVIAVIATHAAEYAGMDKTAGAAFVTKVRAFTASNLTGTRGPHCLVVFAAADGKLTVTMGTESVSQPLPS